MNYLYVDDVDTELGARRRVVIRLWKAGASSESEGKPRRDLLTDLAVLLDSRYMLAERVYFHPAKLKVGTMLGRSALEAKRIGALTEETLLNFGDDTLLGFLESLPQSEFAKSKKSETRASANLAGSLAREVLDRKLYKRVHRYQEEDFSESADDQIPVRDKIFDALLDAESRALQEDEIAATLSIQPGHVLIYVGPKKMNMKVAKAIVDWRGGRKKLSDLTASDDSVLSDRLRSIENSHLRLWVVDLFAHPSVEKSLHADIRSAFEAKFGSKSHRQVNWLAVMLNVARDKSLDNYRANDVNDACKLAAAELSTREPEHMPAHDQTPRNRLLSILHSHLKPTDRLV